LNNDGYLDMVIGDYDGYMEFWQNNGNNKFVFQRNLQTSLGVDIDVGYYAKPRLFDFDKDGHLDIVVGSANHIMAYYKNNGANAFDFVRNLKLTSGTDITTSTYPTPWLGWFDGDDYPDLIVGSYDFYRPARTNCWSADADNGEGGRVRYYKNNGTDYYTNVDQLRYINGNAVIIASTTCRNEYCSYYGVSYCDDYYYVSTPVLIDFDKDGYLDLIVQDFDGYVEYYKGLPAIKDTSNAVIDFGTYVGAFVMDYNGDGYLDLLIGRNDDGTIRYYQNNGSDYYSYVDSLRDLTNAVISCSSNGIGHPYLVDFNGDGDIDLICGRNDGLVSYYENNGTGYYAFQRYLQAGGVTIDVGSYANPEVVDLDKDGILDLVIFNSGGTLPYYKGNGDGSFTLQRNLKLTNGTDINTGAYGKPRMIDVNNDGYLDILTGVNDGTMRYYRNNGSAYFTLDYTFQMGAGTVNLDLGDHTDVFALSYNGFNEMYIGEYDGLMARYFYPNNFNVTIQDQANNLMRWSKVDIYESGTSDKKIRSILSNGKLQTGLNFDKIFDIGIETNISATRMKNYRAYNYTIWFKNVRSPDNITVQGNRKWVPESTVLFAKNFTAGHIIPVELHILAPYGTSAVGNLSIEDSTPSQTRIASNILVEKMNSTGVYNCGVQPDNSTYYYIDKTDTGCSFLDLVNSTAGDHVRVSYRIRVAGPEAYTTVGETKTYILPSAYLRYDVI